MKQHGGSSRDMAVVVDWKEKNGKLTAELNFGNPLETKSNIFVGTDTCPSGKIIEIIKDFDLEVGKNFDIKKFKEKLDPKVRVYSRQ